MSTDTNQLYLEDLQQATSAELPWEKLNNKTVMITGATGMLGKTLIDIIMYKNKVSGTEIHIIAMGRNKEKAYARFCRYWDDPLFTFWEHDIKEPIHQTKYSADYIIHAASTTHPRAYAAEPVDTITANVIGLYHLMEYAIAEKAERVAFLSSVEIYGENRGDTDKFTEEYSGYIDCNTLRAGYPESKRASEALCQAYSKQFGISVVIPRLSRIYGPTMQESDSKAIAQFIQKAVRGEDIILKSAGNQLYSYTYVIDAAVAILLILLKGGSGEAYNISDDESEITLKEIAVQLAETADVKIKYELPEAVEKEGYSKANYAVLEPSKLMGLGWKPDTHIKEGLKKSVLILKELK